MPGGVRDRMQDTGCIPGVRVFEAWARHSARYRVPGPGYQLPGTWYPVPD